MTKCVPKQYQRKQKPNYWTDNKLLSKVKYFKKQDQDFIIYHNNFDSQTPLNSKPLTPIIPKRKKNVFSESYIFSTKYNYEI